MDKLALDTTFLIDLQNERRARGKPRGALDFLRSHKSTELLLPSVALGEYLEGFADPTGGAARAVVSSLEILNVTAEVASHYAEVTRRLRQAGTLIGSNDLWIACTARAANLPIVTRNVEHFRRVFDLVVVGYAPSSK